MPIVFPPGHQTLGIPDITSFLREHGFSEGSRQHGVMSAELYNEAMDT